MDDATSEALWLRGFTLEIGLYSNESILIYCDTQGAIELLENGNFSHRKKHIAVRCYFVCKNILCSLVRLEHIRSEDMLADMLTKTVKDSVVQKFLPFLGLFKFSD